MKILQLFGFGDTNTLLTVAFRRLGYECDAIFSNRMFVTQYPHWTKQYPELKEGVYHWNSANLHDPSTLADLYKFVRQYDLLFAHPPAGVYAWNMGVPFVMWDGGSGNFAFPQKWAKMGSRKLTHEIVRRSYQKAKWCFFNDIDVIYNHWHNLDWAHDRYCYMPLPTDTELFRPMHVEPFDRFTAYFPTRQEATNKGIEEILQGWKLFTTDIPDAQLLITKYGSDVPVTEHYIHHYGLEDTVKWVPLLPKPKYAELLNKADVVIDQVKRGVLGGIADQALSCNRPIICYIKHKWYREQLGESPPVASAQTPQQIAKVLQFAHRARRITIPEGRSFIKRHFEYMTVAKKIINILENSL